MLTQKHFRLALSFALLFFQACNEEDDTVFNSTEDYSYNLTYNGCSTGDQRFDSKSKMCEGLKNDSLNNGCAKDMRRNYFKTKKCVGDFEAPTQQPSPPVGNPPPAPQPTPTPDDTEAKESFKKTFVNGNKEWDLKNISILYLRKNALNGQTLETKTYICSTYQPMNIYGNEFLETYFLLETFNCNQSVLPSAFVYMATISREMVYGGKHIPTPSTPNQFQLKLKKAVAPHFKWASQETLNSLVNDDAVTFDFHGTRNLSGFGVSEDYYFLASFSRRQDSKVDFKINFSYSDGMETYELSAKEILP